MTLAPDPRWDSILATSDEEDAWRERQSEQDRRFEMYDAPLSAAGAPDAATTEPLCSTVDQAQGRPVPSPGAGAGRDTSRVEPSHSAEAYRGDDATGSAPAEGPVAEPPCPACGGEMVVPIAGPDEFGNYDVDDCPTCAVPDHVEAARGASDARAA